MYLYWLGFFLSKSQQCWRALEILIYGKTNLLFLIKSIDIAEGLSCWPLGYLFKTPLQLEFESIGNV